MVAVFSMFARRPHQLAHTLLSQLDPDLLAQSQAFFGGDTAISMALDEFRVSTDVDFLISSRAGYRALREQIHDAGLAALFTGTPPPTVRPLRADQYGVRVFLEIDGQPLKLEFISEGRIDLDGQPGGPVPVPLLSRTSMYAEKLLAMVDRGLDRATQYRDVFDLLYMIHRWGPIPEAAIAEAKRAYGRAVRQVARKIIEHLKKHPEQVAHSMGTLDMTSTARDVITHALALADPLGLADDTPR